MSAPTARPGNPATFPQAALILIKHRLTGLSRELNGTVSREGRAVVALTGIVEDLAMVVEHLQRADRAVAALRPIAEIRADIERRHYDGPFNEWLDSVVRLADDVPALLDAVEERDRLRALRQPIAEGYEAQGQLLRDAKAERDAARAEVAALQDQLRVTADCAENERQRAEKHRARAGAAEARVAEVEHFASGADEARKQIHRRFNAAMAALERVRAECRDIPEHRNQPGGLATRVLAAIDGGAGCGT